ncbi:MAG: D-alanyl carrier protein [Pseudonocardiales bacterium]|nr:MAG: D-alanyl carrier protein [Pseudonocardiales bacterium]
MNDHETSRVREFVSKHTDGIQVDDDLDLFASGLVNSLFIVQLVMWIERTFDIPAENKDLDLVNFRSVSAVMLFVDRKRAVSNSTGT